MTRTSRIRFNPPLGSMPVLQFIPLDQLMIDGDYQRSIEGGESQSLIRKIAQHWNWDLCQPLVVSRRTDRSLFVIDGQHRLAAGRMRGDISQLPCVVVDYADPADEAASFVNLNQQRRRLSKLELFKAAVASGDGQALAIVAAIDGAGLSLAPHSNYTVWKPGMINNIGGIEAAWRKHGGDVATAALRVMAYAYDGIVLRYAGSIYPGMVAVCAHEFRKREMLPDGLLRHMASVLGACDQVEWRRRIAVAKSDDINLRFSTASARVMLFLWCQEVGEKMRRIPSKPTPPVTVDPVTVKPARVDPVAGFRPDGLGDGPVGIGDGAAWCEQCELRISADQFATCKSRFCSLRGAA